MGLSKNPGNVFGPTPPVDDGDLVAFDGTTGKQIESGEAPKDGQQYARQDGGWVIVTPGGLPEFPDNLFRVIDDGDPTKKMAFEIANVSTATTRTLTVQDNDGTIALTADIITDHGDLTGLTDDDHLQYHTDARGDVRYYQKIEFIDFSNGAFDAGKPIVLASDGKIDPSMYDASGGSGDVTGPAGATQDALAKFDDTTGKLIAESTVIDDGVTVSTTLPFDAFTLEAANLTPSRIVYTRPSGELEDSGATDDGTATIVITYNTPASSGTTAALVAIGGIGTANDLYVGDGEGNHTATIDGGVGFNSTMVLSASGTPRWEVRRSAAQSLDIRALDAGGLLIDTPITVPNVGGNPVVVSRPLYVTDVTESVGPLSGSFVTGGGIGTSGNINASGTIKAGPTGGTDGILVADSGASSESILDLKAFGNNRWRITKDDVTETGSNAGSNFAIRRYNDAGALLSTPISIDRASGDITMTGTTTIVDSLQLDGPLNITDNTPSVSPVTGALTVVGGLGVGGQINTSAAINSGGVLTSSGALTVNGTGASSVAGSFTVGLGGAATRTLSIEGDDNLDFIFRPQGVGAWRLRRNGSNNNFAISALDSGGLLIDSPILIQNAAGGNATFSRPSIFTDNTASSSATTGAVTIPNGGLGVGGDINGGGSVVASANIQGQGTFHTFGGTGAAIPSVNLICDPSSTCQFTWQQNFDKRFDLQLQSSGNLRFRAFDASGVSIDNTLVLPNASTGAISTPRDIRVDSTTASTSSSTGALRIPGGGLGVGGDIFCDGIVTGATAMVSSTVQANFFAADDPTFPSYDLRLNGVEQWGINTDGSFFYVDRWVGGAYVDSPFVIETATSDTFLSGDTTFTSSTPSTAATNGAVVIGGGLGVVGDINTGGTVNAITGFEGPSINFGQDALNAFERDTWTPVLTDGVNTAAITVNNAAFIRVNDLVLVQADITVVAVNGVGDACLDGLPYAAAGSAAIAVNGIEWNSNEDPEGQTALASTEICIFDKRADRTASQKFVSGNNIGAGGRVIVTGQYVAQGV